MNTPRVRVSPVGSPRPRRGALA